MSARRCTIAATTVASLLALACREAPPPARAEPSADSATVVVAGPTFVGFFPPVTDAEVAADDDLNTVLDDFGWHVSEATDSLRRSG